MWLILSPLFFKEIWKNGKGATDICLRALKESKALRLGTNSTAERRRREGRAKMSEVPAEIKPEMGFGNV